LPAKLTLSSVARSLSSTVRSGAVPVVVIDGPSSSNLTVIDDAAVVEEPSLSVTVK
jgi:hypothetical protein